MHKNVKKLNLGCGKDKMKDFLNIDISKEVGPDKVWDLCKGLPFIEDNSIEYIFSSHCLEHIRPDKYHFLIDEIFRVSKEGCIWEFILPFDNIQTRTNNEHFRTYSWTSFQQYEHIDKYNYYRKGKLVRIHKKVSILEKLWYNLFPFLKPEIRFKYKVKK